MCVSGVNVCTLVKRRELIRSYLDKKKNVTVSPRCASLEPTHRTTHTVYAHTHTHTLVRSTSRSPARSSWKLRSPTLPPPHLSYPPLPFMTLCNLLIWNWVLVTQSQGLLLEVEESSRSRREGGTKWGGSKQVAGDLKVWRWRGREHVCGHSRSRCPFLCLSLSLVDVGVATMFPHHRLWSASSLPGGFASIMHLGPCARTHTDTHTRYPQRTLSAN